MTRLPIAAVLALALCACTTAEGDGAYPSLARRPAERLDGQVPVCPAGGEGRISGTTSPVEAQPEAPLPPVRLDPSLAARLAGLVDEALAADRTFSARRGRAERLVSAAGRAAVASESWSVASIALADLEAARDPAQIALAELDRLYADERIEHYQAVTPDAEAIAAARERVMAIVSGQSEVLLTLRRRLGV